VKRRRAFQKRLPSEFQKYACDSIKAGGLLSKRRRAFQKRLPSKFQKYACDFKKAGGLLSKRRRAFWEKQAENDILQQLLIIKIMVMNTS